MKKLLILSLLVLSLKAEVCWNTDTEHWIEFSWTTTSNPFYNAVDDELNKLEVYPGSFEVWGCNYIKE